MAGNIFQIARINQQQTINSNRFSLKFSGLSNLLKKAKTSPLPGVREREAAVLAAFGSETTVDTETALEISLFSVTLPAVTLEHQFISKFNDGVKAITKFAEMEDMTVTFWDYVNGSASAIMQLWHAMVGDKKTGAIGFKQDFVLPKAYFMVYGPDAPGYEADDAGTLDIPFLQKYEIVNLFPKVVNLGEHSAETAEARRVEVTFAVDNIYPQEVQTYNYTNQQYTTQPQPAFD